MTFLLKWKKKKVLYETIGHNFLDVVFAKSTKILALIDTTENYIHQKEKCPLPAISFLSNTYLLHTCPVMTSVL